MRTTLRSVRGPGRPSKWPAEVHLAIGPRGVTRWRIVAADLAELHGGDWPDGDAAA